MHYMLSLYIKEAHYYFKICTSYKIRQSNFWVISILNDYNCIILPKLPIEVTCMYNSLEQGSQLLVYVNFLCGSGRKHHIYNYHRPLPHLASHSRPPQATVLRHWCPWTAPAQNVVHHCDRWKVRIMLLLSISGKNKRERTTHTVCAIVIIWAPKCMILRHNSMSVPPHAAEWENIC